MKVRNCVFMLKMKITTGEFHLNFAGADGSPGLSSLVHSLAHNFGESNLGPEYALSPVEMSVCLPKHIVQRI